MAQNLHSPIAAETISIRLEDQPNTICTDRREIQVHEVLSSENSVASQEPASLAPSLDIVHVANADHQIEPPAHKLPEVDDHAYPLPERQDTEADLGVPTSASPTGSNGRA